MATKTNEQLILDMLAKMDARLDALETAPAKRAKPAKSARTALTLTTGKAPSLASTEKGIDPTTKCCGIVYPKKRDYEQGNALEIMRCTIDKVPGSDRCKYHTADNATRHAAFQGLHGRMFPVWETAIKKASSDD